MLFLKFFIVFLLNSLQLCVQINAGTFSVDYSNHQFLKDGQPFQYISGDIHYFRIHPDQWNDRLQRVKALGLNVVQVYVPWNFHETWEGTYDFSGQKNLTQFVLLAQQNNLNVNLRPSPFIDAEFENEGIPYFLLKYPSIRLRSSDKNYTNALQKWYNVLMGVIKPLLYKNGGPVLMVAIENEYGICGVCDLGYTKWLRDLIWSILGNDTVLYTINPVGSLGCGGVPDVVNTMDFAPTSHEGVDRSFEQQGNYTKGVPYVCSEFYTCWGVEWGARSATLFDSDGFVDNLKYMHTVWNASVNIYMIHGGKNFEFWNGARGNPYITQYWVYSPIDENGDITEYALKIRSTIANLTNWSNPPLAIPNNNSASAYGQVTMQKIGQSLPATLGSIQENCSYFPDPKTFEELDYPYGYVLYTTTIKNAGKLLLTPHIRDFGYVFLNNIYQGMLDHYTNATKITFNSSTAPGDTLRILVENRGRHSQEGIITKGLFLNVTLDGNLLQDWFSCGINLTKSAIDSLTTNYMDDTTYLEEKDTLYMPGVYVGKFTANPIQDTFFNSTGWGKGQLFINGYNLGRYWPTKGPQMTLYIPAPVLRATNTILLIELNGAQQNYAELIDHSFYKF